MGMKALKYRILTDRAAAFLVRPAASPYHRPMWRVILSGVSHVLRFHHS